jgi:hypothetical protein
MEITPSTVNADFAGALAVDGLVAAAVEEAGVPDDGVLTL